MTTSRTRPVVRALAPVALVAVLVGLTGCGDDEPAADGPVTVSDGWARTSAATQTNGAAYVVITGGAEDDVLTGVSVSPDVAGMAQVHETVMSHGSDDTGMTDDTGMDHGGGSMTMQEVDEVEIPAGETVTFEPGGYHVMLMELAEPLETGSTFDLDLTFEKAGTLTVEVEVREE